MIPENLIGKFPQEQLEKLYAPAQNARVVVSPSVGECANITVRTADGRVFDLGKPTSFLFKARLALYKWRRRRELKEKVS